MSGLCMNSQMIMIPYAAKALQPGAFARDMLQRDRVLQGVRWTIGPVLHTPFHTGGE